MSERRREEIEMSKKVCNFVLVFIVLMLVTSINAFAGDIPEGIMLGEQKALFIGEIAAIDTDTISITPTTVMMGNIKQSVVKIKKFEEYHGTSDKPQIGDFIVAVLLDDDKIDETWVFKSTSDDYKSLKLIGQPDELVIRYEKYINEGEYFEAQKRVDDKAKESFAPANAIVPIQQSQKDSLTAQSHREIYIIVAVLGLLIAFVIFVAVTIIKKRHSS